ncbi:MAG TPA: DNA ligase, partial [Albitalea sp.]|nr:DNA ligase [Albitalea sp.]
MTIDRRHFVARLAGCALFPLAAHARPADAPPVLLAQVADPGVDPSGYLVSEKYDGARALWDGR